MEKPAKLIRFPREGTFYPYKSETPPIAMAESIWNQRGYMEIGFPFTPQSILKKLL